MVCIARPRSHTKGGGEREATVTSKPQQRERETEGKEKREMWERWRERDGGFYGEMWEKSVFYKRKREKVGFIENTAMRHRWGG